MLPSVNLSIKQQQLFLDHFANTYSPHRTPHVRYSPFIIIWATYKPRNIPSSFLALSLLQCHPKRVVSVVLVWAGNPHSFPLLFLHLLTNQRQRQPPPLCSAEAVAAWLAQGLMRLLRAFPDRRCITRCVTVTLYMPQVTGWEAHTSEARIANFQLFPIYFIVMSEEITAPISKQSYLGTSTFLALREGNSHPSDLQSCLGSHLSHFT